MYGRFVRHALAGVLLIAALGISLTYLIDPYGEHGQEDGLYLAARPPTIDRYRDFLAKEPHVLVFGTSRSHMISDEVVGEKVLNLFAVYGWPQAVSAFLGGLDEVRLHNVRGIIYCLDLHTLVAPDVGAIYEPNGWYGRLRYRLDNLRAYIRDSAGKVWAKVTGRHSFHIHARGFKVQDERYGWDEIWRPGWRKESQRIDPVEVARLAEIKRFAEDRGIPILFMTPTLPDLTLNRDIDLDALRRQRRAIVGAISEYVELTRIPGISDRREMFSDASHLNAAGQRALFARYPWRDRVANRQNIEGFLNELVPEGR